MVQPLMDKCIRSTARANIMFEEEQNCTICAFEKHFSRVYDVGIFALIAYDDSKIAANRVLQQLSLWNGKTMGIAYQYIVRSFFSL